MAQGTPVISFNIKNSGVGEINKNQTGILLEVKDNFDDCEKDLFLAMETLIKDKKILNLYSKNAYRVSKQYSSNVVFKLYEELFYNLGT